MKTRTTRRAAASLLAFSAAALVAPALTGCDKDTSKSKQTTVRESTGPDGTKRTTETTEKKVEVEHKNPN
ncbi:MAG: hypothetical protein K2Q09_01970 [Phycisphaerales bacterium]|nr:hypothetical protein [Phycisphaerales bacterium]